MIAPRVPTEGEIFDWLRDLGFEETEEETSTGSFWRHKKSGSHLQVPKSIQGYFPDWLMALFWSQAHAIAASGKNKPPKKRKAKAKPKSKKAS